MSATAIPDAKPEQRFSIEEIASDGKAVLQKGGSAVDEREMMRMGKKQELRVSKFAILSEMVALLKRSSVTSSLWELSALLRSFNLPGSVFY